MYCKYPERYNVALLRYNLAQQKQNESSETVVNRALQKITLKKNMCYSNHCNYFKTIKKQSDKIETIKKNVRLA